MNIEFTKKFEKMLNMLSDEVQEKAIQKWDVFRKNPFERSLKTHKLKGKFRNCYSFSVDFNYRIVFRFLDTKNDVLFLLIGSHSIYQ